VVVADGSASVLLACCWLDPDDGRGPSRLSLGRLTVQLAAQGRAVARVWCCRRSEGA
jgi:hypothetical protein